MPIFNVTVCRTGSIRIEAETAEEAMEICNEKGSLDDVVWDDDWPATDAEEEEADA